jgi:hypothetical protein
MEVWIKYAPWHRTPLSQFIRATITQYHSLDGVLKQKFISQQSFGDYSVQKSKNLKIWCLP